MKNALILASLLYSQISGASNCEDRFKESDSSIVTKVNKVIECERVNETLSIFSGSYPKLCILDVDSTEGRILITGLGSEKLFSFQYNHEKKNNNTKAATITETKDTLFFTSKAPDSRFRMNIYETRVTGLTSNNPKATFKHYQKTSLGHRVEFYSGEFSCSAVQVND